MPDTFDCLNAAVASLILTTACGIEGREGSRVLIRDSAGIEIVENIAPAWTEGDGWRLSDEPVLTIGVLEGREEYQLFNSTGGAPARWWGDCGRERWDK